MGHEPALNIEVGRRLLFDVVDLLDQHGIPYHLEGGTLLGLVRDGDLLPWDHDLDISVPAEHIHRFNVWHQMALRWKLWRVSQRRFTADSAEYGWRKGDLRIFKVTQRDWIFKKGWPQLDIFVKYKQQEKTWWAAKGKVMGVDAAHYDGYETLSYRGRMLKVPRHPGEYLSAKYGDWSVPVKEWDCGTDEKTIAAALRT